jgi:lysophospholipase L1-like esterase
MPRLPFAPAARKIATAALILLISLALGEIVLRIYNRISPNYVFFSDSYNRFRVKAHSRFLGFSTNSFGFYDTEFSKPGGEAFRIVALGDSFAFGVVPYQHNYLTLVEERLAQEGVRADVLNMGISRTSPSDYLNLLVNEGFAHEPDLVVVSFYVGNDLIDTYNARQGERPLHERSYVVSLLRFAFRFSDRVEPNPADDRLVYRDDAPTLSRPAYLDIIGNRAKIYMVGWEGLSVAVDGAMGAIEEIARICGRRGIPAVVVLIPDETQLNPELQGTLAATYRVYREGQMDYLQPNRILAERLDGRGISFLDLFPAFSEAARTERLYKPLDTHWNIAGNRLAAEQIADFLVAQGLVPVSGAR